MTQEDLQKTLPVGASIKSFRLVAIAEIVYPMTAKAHDNFTDWSLAREGMRIRQIGPASTRRNKRMSAIVELPLDKV